ncbi:hypothetical protein Emed_002508 [Eimeria media]
MSPAPLEELPPAEGVESLEEETPGSKANAEAVAAAAEEAAAEVGAARIPPKPHDGSSLRALRYCFLLIALLYSVGFCNPALHELRAAGREDEGPALTAGPSEGGDKAIEDALPPESLPGFPHVPGGVSGDPSSPPDLPGDADPAPLVIPPKPPRLYDITAAGEEGMGAQGQPGGPLVSAEDEMSEDRGPPSRPSQPRVPFPPPAAAEADKELVAEAPALPPKPPRDPDVGLTEPTRDAEVLPSTQPKYKRRAPPPPPHAAAVHKKKPPQPSVSSSEPPRDAEEGFAQSEGETETGVFKAWEETEEMERLLAGSVTSFTTSRPSETSEAEPPEDTAEPPMESSEGMQTGPVETPQRTQVPPPKPPRQRDKEPSSKLPRPKAPPRPSAPPALKKKSSEASATRPKPVEGAVVPPPRPPPPVRPKDAPPSPPKPARKEAASETEARSLTPPKGKPKPPIKTSQYSEEDFPMLPQKTHAQLETLLEEGDESPPEGEAEPPASAAEGGAAAPSAAPPAAAEAAGETGSEEEAQDEDDETEIPPANREPAYKVRIEDTPPPMKPMRLGAESPTQPVEGVLLFFSVDAVALEVDFTEEELACLPFEEACIRGGEADFDVNVKLRALVSVKLDEKQQHTDVNDDHNIAAAANSNGGGIACEASGPMTACVMTQRRQFASLQLLPLPAAAAVALQELEKAVNESTEMLSSSLNFAAAAAGAAAALLLLLLLLLLFLLTPGLMLGPSPPSLPLIHVRLFPLVPPVCEGPDLCRFVPAAVAAFAAAVVAAAPKCGAALHLLLRMSLEPVLQAPHKEAETMAELAAAELSSWLTTTEETATQVIVGSVALEVLCLQEGAFNEDLRKQLATRVVQGRQELSYLRVSSSLLKAYEAHCTLSTSFCAGRWGCAAAGCCKPRLKRSNGLRMAKPSCVGWFCGGVAFWLNPSRFEIRFTVDEGDSSKGTVMPVSSSSPEYDMNPMAAPLVTPRAPRPVSRKAKLVSLPFGRVYAEIRLWLRHSTGPSPSSLPSPSLLRFKDDRFYSFVHEALQIRVRMGQPRPLEVFMDESRKQARKDLADELWYQRDRLGAAIYAASEKQVVSRRAHPAESDASVFSGSSKSSSSGSKSSNRQQQQQQEQEQQQRQWGVRVSCCFAQKPDALRPLFVKRRCSKPSAATAATGGSSNSSSRW